MNLKYILPGILLLPLCACAPRHEAAPISCAGSIPLVAEGQAAPVVQKPTVKRTTYKKRRAAGIRRTSTRRATAKRTRVVRPVQQARAVTPPIPLPLTPIQPSYNTDSSTYVITPPLQ